MNGFSTTMYSEDEQDREAVNHAALYVAWKERLGMPVVAERVAREQPEHLQAYFWELLQHYRRFSMQMPDKNAQEYAKNEDTSNK